MDSSWEIEGGVPDVVERRGIERVQPLRALNRERRHAGLTLNEQVVKGHRASETTPDYTPRPHGARAHH